jgi:hypothetical protein
MPKLSPTKSTCQLSSIKCQRANTKCSVHPLTKSPQLDNEAQAKATKKASDQAAFQARLRITSKEGLPVQIAPKPEQQPKKIRAGKAEWRSHVEACRAQKKVDDLTNEDLMKEDELVITDASILSNYHLIKAEMLKEAELKNAQLLAAERAATLIKAGLLEAELIIAAELLKKELLKEAELVQMALLMEVQLAAALLQEAEAQQAELKVAEEELAAELTSTDTPDITTVPKKDTTDTTLNQLSPISCPQSAVPNQLSPISCPQSAIPNQLSPISCPQSAVPNCVPQSQDPFSLSLDSLLDSQSSPWNPLDPLPGFHSPWIQTQSSMFPLIFTSTLYPVLWEPIFWSRASGRLSSLFVQDS